MITKGNFPIFAYFYPDSTFLSPPGFYVFKILHRPVFLFYRAIHSLFPFLATWKPHIDSNSAIFIYKLSVFLFLSLFFIYTSARTVALRAAKKPSKAKYASAFLQAFCIPQRVILPVILRATARRFVPAFYLTRALNTATEFRQQKHGALLPRAVRCFAARLVKVFSWHARVLPAFGLERHFELAALQVQAVCFVVYQPVPIPTPALCFWLAASDNETRTTRAFYPGNAARRCFWHACQRTEKNFGCCCRTSLQFLLIWRAVTGRGRLAGKHCQLQLSNNIDWA